MEILEGSIVRLRAPEPEDLEFLYHWENNTDLWLVSNTLTPFSRYTLKKFIEESHRDIYENKQLRFMIDIKENVARTIGTIDLYDFEPYHHRIGIGILIGEELDRGKGFADDALKILINYGFSVLGLHQFYCNVTANNQASLHLFQNNGFEIIGVKKDWLRTVDGWTNEYLLQLIKKHV
jgi:diamine N-acetyltransferase